MWDWCDESSLSFLEVQIDCLKGHVELWDWVKTNVYVNAVLYIPDNLYLSGRHQSFLQNSSWFLSNKQNRRFLAYRGSACGCIHSILDSLGTNRWTFDERIQIVIHFWRFVYRCVCHNQNAFSKQCFPPNFFGFIGTPFIEPYNFFLQGSLFILDHKINDIYKNDHTNVLIGCINNSSTNTFVICSPSHHSKPIWLLCIFTKDM